MPISYTIKSNLVSARGSGVVTADDVMDHLKSLAADERYQVPMKKLVDYREIESIQISQKEAELVAATKSKLAANFRSEQCAFVSPTDLSYGTSRVHQALVESAETEINTEVFRSIEDARHWLQISPDD